MPATQASPLPYLSIPGILGGQRYPGTASLGPTFTSTVTDTTVRTGTVTMTFGRLYAVDFCGLVQTSATADVIAYVGWEVVKTVDGATVSGAGFATQNVNGQGTYLHQWSIDYAPTATETTDLRLNAFIVKYAGTTLNWGLLNRGPQTFFRVRDIGPANTMTSV